MIPRCDQCKWWGDLAWNENHPRHATQRICNNSGLKAEPGYDGAAIIATEPDFGCVQFEVKEI